MKAKSEKIQNEKLSDRTKSLNQSGAFLQIYVINELKKRGWSTLAEYPIRASPFISEPQNHQLTAVRFQLSGTHVSPEIFVRAAIESQNKSEVKETSIDVIGGKRISGADFTLCIESKKLDPRYMDWIFFKQEQHQDVMRIISRSLKKNGLVQLFTTLPTRDCQYETYLEMINYPLWEPSRREIVDFALALKKNEIENEYYKSEKTKVDESARQIIEGTYGLIIEKILQEMMKGEPVLYAHVNEIVIPIIVTNANLFICNISPYDIDSKTGHANKEPEYRQVDSLVYECAAPKTVQFPDPLSADLTSEQHRCATKWHVLIVSPKGFRDFLDSVQINT